MMLSTRLIIRSIAVVTAVVLLAIPVSMLLVGAGKPHEQLLSINSRMDSLLLSQAVIVNDNESASRISRFNVLSRNFDTNLAEALSITEPGSGDRSHLAALAHRSYAWRVAALQAIAAPSKDTPTLAAQRRKLIAGFAKESDTMRLRQLNNRNADNKNSRRATIAIALLLVAFASISGAATLIGRIRRRTALNAEERRLLVDDKRHRLEQEEYTRALQGARTEREAHRMLKRQIERSVKTSRVTVFNRNNSDDRLEAVTAIPAGSPLAEVVPDAEPSDCLAVRFGQSFERADGDNPLLACELCGALPGSVTCLPSLVSGEVIGSVLVESDLPLVEEERRRLADGVAHAAPVLASMRNLHLAETQASTDQLTGLANRRSAEPTFKLILANANRNLNSCAIVMMDLDHFKKVNDVHGHEAGDQLLASVGVLLGAGVRASDLVARFGGEEFLIVLSNTDLESAINVCNKLRRAIGELDVLGSSARASASFGVAMFPADATDMEGLLRGSDRALYAAKGAGRNCVKALQKIEESTANASGDTEIKSIDVDDEVTAPPPVVTLVDANQRDS